MIEWCVDTNELNARKKKVVHAYVMYWFECVECEHDCMYVDVELNI